MNARIQIDDKALAAWFDVRPRWIREALGILLERGALTAADIQRLAGICRDPGSVGKAIPVAPEALAPKAGALVIRLKSLSEPKGIDTLNPKTPLTFGPEPVTIVYGLNGAGKSGYIRILNHVCGSKNRRPLIGHVFEGAVEKSCKIGYDLNGVPKGILWTPAQGKQPELESVEIYDSEGGLVYVTENNEVAFEPWLLGIFQSLIDACAKVDGILGREIDGLVSAKPALPPEYNPTQAGIWYSVLKAGASTADITTWTTFGNAEQDEIASLQARLLERNPAEQARTLRTLAAAIRTELAKWREMAAAVSPEVVTALLAARSNAASKTKAATEDAKKVFDNAPLDGVGMESWKLLWAQARAYSEDKAYPKGVFPFVGEGARCVLCQNELGADAGKRLEGFERFVKGALETEAKAAAKLLANLTDALPQVPSTEALDVRLAALGIDADPYSSQMHFYRDQLALRCSSLKDATSAEQVTNLPADGLLAPVDGLVTSMDERAKAFEADAAKSDKAALKKQLTALEARKWLSDQKAAIEAEVARLNQIAALENARRHTDTTALSKKKGELAEALVSEAFKQRFSDEMKALGASRIKVELVQSHTTKGHVFHRIQLKDAKFKVSTAEVLSEGERRIVSLAAFLADVEGMDATTPFVFDDPISSLDQDFEEAVVARLAKLAKKRQVIVFTHRLSLPVMLEDALKSDGLKACFVALNREAWGAGQPSSSPISGQKPKAALNSLNDAVARARKVQIEGGQAEYEIRAKAICGDFRVLLERLVEEVLLGGIVQRYRRGVMTEGKIEHLAKIKPSDTKLVDDMMTKYSKFVHSQSTDASVATPEPDDIAADITKLSVWEKEFKERPAPAMRP